KAILDPNFVSAPSHYYTMMKQLTLLGYFTSEIGSKQALRWVPIPGKYDGAYPYKKGDKAWAI
ncbi:MAG: gluconate 2-dehydrogenase subunit 3 family protein, partial [Ferruginibacter sp.]